MFSKIIHKETDLYDPDEVQRLIDMALTLFKKDDEPYNDMEKGYMSDIVD